MSTVDTVMEALDLHLRQWEWSTTAAAETVWSRFAEAYGASKLRKVEDFRTGAEGADVFMDLDQTVLNEGRTVFVTPEIMEAIAPAADTIPNARLTPELLPHQEAFMVLGTPLTYFPPADGGQPIPIRAIGWSRGPVLHTDGSKVDGITIVGYSDSEVMMNMRLDQGLTAWPPDMGSPPPVYPVDVTGWAFHAWWEEGADEDDVGDGRKAPHIAGLRRFLLALWTFMADEIVPVDRHPHLPRPAEKRARRGWPKRTWEDGMATVVHFRKVRTVERDTDDDEDRDPVLRTHSWIVSGHWRKLRDKETGRFEGRVTWVRPHIKGDGPLVIKERISIVHR